MNSDELLRQITIPEPCNADWSSFQGDDRTRFCALCGKHVYNLEAMRTDEAACLIRARNGDLCVRMQIRDERVPGAPVSGRFARLAQFHIRFIMAAIAAVGAFLGITRTWWRSEEPSTPQRVRSTVLMGVPAFPSRLVPPPAGNPNVGGSSQPDGTESCETSDIPCEHEK